MKETPIEETNNFYKRSREAFLYWGNISIKERLAYLKKLRLYMVDHLDELAEIIAKDTGKVLVEALTADILTVLDAVKHIEKHAERALQRKKVPTPILLIGKKSYIEYKPRGVVLVISPWNYPFQLAMIPLVSALAGGNTVILKPSEVTPQVGKLIEELFNKAGFPPNVVQVAHGGKELGAALVNGKPDYIFFTGSVRTGKIIQAEAAKELIPTTLELGGKDPMVVFADANLDRAVKGAVWGAFTNSGQVCMSVERLYVERKVYAQFVEKLSTETKKLKLGTNLNDDLGSMTFTGQVDIVKDHLDDALFQGANLNTGLPSDTWDFKNGLFISPMVITDVNQNMKLVQEESFGPLLPVIPFDTEEEAVQFANDSSYGLNASVWSSDLERAKRVASKLVSGNVVINDVIITVANPYLPFGGVKNSGIGRYHSDIGLQAFCYQTSVMLDKGKKSAEVIWYPYTDKYHLFGKLIHSYFGNNIRWLSFVEAYIGLLKKSK